MNGLKHIKRVPALVFSSAKEAAHLIAREVLKPTADAIAQGINPNESNAYLGCMVGAALSLYQKQVGTDKAIELLEGMKKTLQEHEAKQPATPTVQ